MRKNLYILLLLIPINSIAQQIRVSLFNSFPVKGLTISLYSGSFDIYSGDERITGSDENKILYISLYNNQLIICNSEGLLGSFDEISVSCKDLESKYQVTVIEPKTKGRTLSGPLQLKIEYNRILLINEIELERYIAGVVEAETGINAVGEFYKAQALLCRTYLYSHISRHATEDFNLCDEVHCQVYKGITPFSNYIHSSTILTKNQVVTNALNEMITATFHANCGGETASALDNWLKAEDYLVPVKDPYCKNSLNSNWEQRIPLSTWKKYLNGHQIKTQGLKYSSFKTNNTGRLNYYKVGNDSIMTRQIRADWNLKSSYFQVLIKNNEVTLKGHGYGHGVGMCQTGAMNMALQGFNCEQIISFYFKGVKIQEVN